MREGKFVGEWFTIRDMTRCKISVIFDNKHGWKGVHKAEYYPWSLTYEHEGILYEACESDRTHLGHLLPVHHDRTYCDCDIGKTNQTRWRLGGLKLSYRKGN